MPSDDPWRQVVTFQIVDGDGRIAAGNPIRYRRDGRGPAPNAEHVQYFTDSLGRRRTAKTRPNPGFPRAAIKRGITSAFTVTTLSVAPSGKVLQTEVVFAFPKGHFEDKSREGFERWEFEPLADPEDARVGNVCIDLTFIWDGRS